MVSAMAFRPAGSYHHGRIAVALCCEVCGTRNYRTSKARLDTGRALKLKKFCKICNAHTLHLEGK